MADALATPEVVNLVNPSGQLVGVSADEMQAALRAGYRQESPQEYEKRWREKTYGDTGGMLKGALAGAARGLSFGLSDQLLTRSHLVDPRVLASLKEANPIASTVGEVAGIAAPLLLSGGIGVIAEGARVAGGLTRAAAGVGRAAEGLTAEALGGLASRGVAGQLLAKGAAKAAGGAAEGALYGVGQVVSEDAIGPAKLTAEQMIAHVGLSALLGGGVGGGLGIASEVAPKVASKVASAVAGYVSKKLKGSTPAEVAADWLSDVAGSEALRATLGQQKRAFVQLEDKGLIDKAKALLTDKDLGLVVAGDTNERIATKVAAHKERVGQQLRTIVEKLDESTAMEPEYRVVAAEVADRVENTVLAPLQKSAAKRSVASQVEAEVQAIRDLGDQPMTFTAAAKQRADMQDLVNYDLKANQVTPITEARKEIARIWNDVIDSKVAGIVKDAGADEAVQKSYREIRHDFALASRLDEYATNRVQGNRANRTISPTDYGAAIGTGGAVIASGGAALPGVLAAAGAGAVNNLARRYGPAAISSVAGSLSRALSGIKAASDGTSSRITDAITGYVSKIGTGAVKASVPASVTALHGRITEAAVGERPKKQRKQPPADAYKARMGELAQLASNPEEMSRRVAAAIEPIAQAAPKTAMALSETGAKAVAFLHARAPKNPTPPAALNVMAKRWQPSAAQASKFARYIAAVEDPTTVLDDLLAGRVSHEAAEALREVYPELHAKIRDSLIERVAELQEEIPYVDRVQLSLLFGAPLDPTMLPAFVASIQQGFAEQVQAKQEQKQQQPTSAQGTLAARLAPKSDGLMENT